MYSFWNGLTKIFSGGSRIFQIVGTDQTYHFGYFFQTQHEIEEKDRKGVRIPPRSATDFFIYIIKRE